MLINAILCMVDLGIKVAFIVNHINYAFMSMFCEYIYLFIFFTCGNVHCARCTYNYFLMVSAHTFFSDIRVTVNVLSLVGTYTRTFFQLTSMR